MIKMNILPNGEWRNLTTPRIERRIICIFQNFTIKTTYTHVDFKFLAIKNELTFVSESF